MGYGYVFYFCVMRHTLEPLEQRDAGIDAHPHSRSVIVRKYIVAAFVLVLSALMLTAYFYYRSAYLRRAGNWSLFWIGEVIIGVWLVFAVVHILRKGP